MSSRGTVLGAALMFTLGAVLGVCRRAREHGAVARTGSMMSVRFIFRCRFCEAQPDPMTQLSLEKAMRENTWGAYQNALPGRRLVFHGRGLYGSPRYACAEHRGDLVA
jgi:hypothetical protein